MRPIPITALLTALLLATTACSTTANNENGPTSADDSAENSAEAVDNDAVPQETETDAPGQIIKSALERDSTPDLSDATRDKLSADNSEFAFNLMETIRAGDEGNIFFSPHSISIALAMAYAGADGATKEQLQQALNFTLPPEELHPAFNSLDQELASRSEKNLPQEAGDPPTLNIVNAIWGQQDYPFAPDYLDLLARNYGAGLQGVDFKTNSEEIRQDINQWVEDQTNERIQNLLAEGTVDSSTRLILTNAIYFLAGWQTPFPEPATSDQPFTLLSGDQVEAPLMGVTDNFQFYTDDSTNAVSLAYVGGDLSFIALQPAESDDFSAWESALDHETLANIVDGLSSAHGRVELPRFKSQGDYQLMQLFASLGWTDFTNLDAMRQDGAEPLEISEIVHKSFIDLDEEGTEAAAATAIGVRTTSLPMVEYELRFDRPFYYVIYDHPTDTILFLGRMMDPTE